MSQLMPEALRLKLFSPSMRMTLAGVFLIALSGVSVPALAQEESPAVEVPDEEAQNQTAAENPANDLIIPHYDTGGSVEIRGGSNTRQAVRFIAVRDDPPFVFERRGLALGLYVDFVREMCDVANLACVIDLIPREQLLDEPLGDRDVLIGAFPNVRELAGKYDFTQPILQNTGRILVRKDSPLQRGWPEDLAPIRLGVVSDGPYARFVSEVLELEAAAVFDDLRAGLDSLSAGAVDAIFADGLRLNFFLTTPSGNCCRILPGAYHNDAYFNERTLMAVRQNNAALRQLMSSSIDNLTRDEVRWGQIYLKYFPFGLY